MASCPVGLGKKEGGCGDDGSANKMGPANQRPAEGQAYALPKERATSSIPNAAGQPWVYPSEQVRLCTPSVRAPSPDEAGVPGGHRCSTTP